MSALSLHDALPIFTQRLDVDGMQTLGALNDLELHRLSGLERAISIHLDGRIMGEEVFVTSFRDDEAIPLGIIEPFDLADLHAAFLCCPQTSPTPDTLKRIQGTPVTLFNSGSF